MASVEGGAGLPTTSRADTYEISDTESDSSYAGSSAPASPCPYRSSHSFDGECTRYFDCPTHILERSHREHEEAGPSSRPSQPEEDRPESGQETSVIDRIDRAEAGSSLPTDDQHRDDVVTDLPNPAPAAISLRQEDESQGRRTTAQPREEPISRGDDGLNTPITLREALNETGEGRNGTTTTTTSEAAIPRITHASANPLARNSVLNPIAPGFNPRAERRSPLEFALPRWQPDAEVTYCPICGTQFGFFVRKHHCR